MSEIQYFVTCLPCGRWKSRSSLSLVREPVHAFRHSYCTSMSIGQRHIDGRQFGRSSTPYSAPCARPKPRCQTSNRHCANKPTRLQEAIACSDPEWRFSMWEMPLKEINKHRAFPKCSMVFEGPRACALRGYPILNALESGDKLEKKG